MTEQAAGGGTVKNTKPSRQEAGKRRGGGREVGGTGEQTKEETSPTESGTVANTKPPGAEP